jgi:hypothetical protein
MTPAPAVLLAWWLAQTTPPVNTTTAPPAAPTEAPGAAPTDAPAEAPAPQAAPPTSEPEPPEMAAPPTLAPPAEPQAYGYRGMSEVSLALGYSSASGFLAGGGFRRFLLAGLAPGVEASVQTGAGTTIGLVLGTLRLVPIRLRQFAFVITGRAGRVLLSDHDDGWGAGGGAGVIVSLAANVGLELGYDVLWLLPASFCADLSSCTLAGPELGLRLAF